MMRLTLGLAALLALSGAAAAHYANHDLWHDFGTNLGGAGASPVGQPLGLCWSTDSTFLDPSDPGGMETGELWGHTAGLGADYDGACDQQAADPSLYLTYTAPEEGKVGGQVGVGLATPDLSPYVALLPPVPEPAIPGLPAL